MFCCIQFYKGSPALAQSYYLNSSNEEYAKFMKMYRALLSETVMALLPSTNKPNDSDIVSLILFETKFANVSINVIFQKF